MALFIDLATKERLDAPAPAPEAPAPSYPRGFEGGYGSSGDELAAGQADLAALRAGNFTPAPEPSPFMGNGIGQSVRNGFSTLGQFATAPGSQAIEAVTGQPFHAPWYIQKPVDFALNPLTLASAGFGGGAAALIGAAAGGLAQGGVEQVDQGLPGIVRAPLELGAGLAGGLAGARLTPSFLSDLTAAADRFVNPADLQGAAPEAFQYGRGNLGTSAVNPSGEPLPHALRPEDALPRQNYIGPQGNAAGQAGAALLTPEQLAGLQAKKAAGMALSPDEIRSVQQSLGELLKLDSNAAPTGHATAADTTAWLRNARTAEAGGGGMAQPYPPVAAPTQPLTGYARYQAGVEALRGSGTPVTAERRAAMEALRNYSGNDPKVVARLTERLNAIDRAAEIASPSGAVTAPTQPDEAFGLERQAPDADGIQWDTPPVPRMPFGGAQGGAEMPPLPQGNEATPRMTREEALAAHRDLLVSQDPNYVPPAPDLTGAEGFGADESYQEKGNATRRLMGAPPSGAFGDSQFRPTGTDEAATPEPPSIASHVANAINFTKTLQTSFSLHGPLRQGIWLTASNKVSAAKAIGDQMGALIGHAEQINAGLDAMPSAGLRNTVGVYMAPTTAAHAALSSGEEAVMSNIVNQWPVMRNFKDAYITYLNSLRANVFDSIVKHWGGVPTFDQNDAAFVNGVATGKHLNDYQQLGRFVNIFTGRGELPRAITGSDSIPALLNGVVFSPRAFTASLQRFYAPVAPGSMGGFSSTAVRAEALKAIVSTVATGVGILGLMKMRGVQVGTDPNSSDFGKYVIGPIHGDIWGGEQQPVAAVAKMISGQTVSTTTGASKPITPLTVIGNYGRNRLSAPTGAAVNLLSGADASGNQVNLNTPTGLGNLAQDASGLKVEGSVHGVPLPVPGIYPQELAEAVKAYGAEGGIITLPSLWGAGATVYGPSGSTGTSTGVRPLRVAPKRIAPVRSPRVR